MAKLLDGVRVLDMSRYIAGPFCSMLLGDMGADVIKIEKPGTGEDSRSMGPFAGDVSLYFTQYNKNKRSVTLNTRSDEGMVLLKQLISGADVLVENFRPGTLDAMGLTKEVLDALNPRLVLTSISGYGQTGPYAGRVAFDAVAQFASGLASLTGEENGPPQAVGSFIVDFSTGIYAALGTVAALYHRRDSGEGQRIDVAMMDSIISMLSTAVPLYTTLGEVEKRWGNRDKVTGPANVYKAKDGYFFIHAGTQPLWKRMAAVLGRPELAEDVRFATVAARMQNVEEAEALVAAWAAGKTMAELESILADAGIVAAPVNDIAAMAAHPQVQHRKPFEYIDYPGTNGITVNGITLKFEKTPGEIRLRPPLLGEHNAEVYGGLLGLGEEELKELRNAGVV